MRAPENRVPEPKETAVAKAAASASTAAGAKSAAADRKSVV
jgi:hypothetical protein